ncbi:MAG: hypothetical protein JRJ03_08635 [Deltaproteobacteria bacterium]|nr:hypothetical protein [Deltaproteobacteria bacterium]
MRVLKEAIRHRSPRKRPTQPFLQPWALAVVCALLIVLLVLMRWLDLRAIDSTLTKYMENRGASIIKNLRYVAEIYRRQLLQWDQVGLEMETGPSITDDAFSLQESFIIDLLQSAQELDYQLGTGPYHGKDLNTLIQREALWLLALLDKDGRVISSNRPVPGDLLQLAAALLNGRTGIRIDIFNRPAKRNKLRSLVLPRKSGKGVMILSMDGRSFNNRIIRFSFRRALQDIGLLPSIGYLIITDKDLHPLGQIGEAPEIKMDQPLIGTVISGEAGISSRRITFNGKRYLDMVSLLHQGDGTTYLVRLGLSRERPGEIREKNRRAIFISMAFMIIITVLSMWLLYKNQNRHLARTREMEKRIQNAERLSSLGRLAAGVAHEIRNPLNAISMAAQRLDRDNLVQLKGVIRDETRRLNEIIEEFLSFSRSRKLAFRRHDLTSLIREVVLLFEEEARSRGVTIDIDASSTPVFVNMDPHKLKQTLINLVKNAIESLSGGGTISIQLAQRGSGRVCVTIADTGPGLGPEELRRIFELDYTTKEKGLGLGLPLAREIIRGHGGELRVESTPGHGTTFEILLPLEKH